MSESGLTDLSNGFPWLGEEDSYTFPDADDATPDGILGVGGNLSPGMLLSAYRQGVFPWYSEGDPLLWWCPDPRFVLFLDKVHVSRSLKRSLRADRFRVTLDQAFGDVIHNCATQPRAGQDGTWITAEMEEAYVRLHDLGYAHSCESWHGEVLVGGIYGVSLGHIFFGESMFSLTSDASKVALVALARTLRPLGFEMIDAQVHTRHVESMGGTEIDRSTFLSRLCAAMEHETLRGNWSEQIGQPTVDQ